MKWPRPTTPIGWPTSRPAWWLPASRAALAANAELIQLYWQIGRDILERQARQGWGSKVIERLARDLRMAFPEMKGFSRANLLYMRAFAEVCMTGK